MEVGTHYPVDLALGGDARTVLEAPPEQAEPHARHEGRRRAIAGFKAERDSFAEPELRSEAMPLKPQRVMRELRDALPAETILFTDIGNNLTWVERCFPVRRGGRVVSTSGLAAVGSGVAGVVGGKLAAPDAPVVCVWGDGGFQMTGLEVVTAVTDGVPAVWDRPRRRPPRDDPRHPDAHVPRASRGRDVAEPRLRRARGRHGGRGPSHRAPGVPTVIDVPIDADELPPMRPRMLALERSVGNPSPGKALSWRTIKATAAMLGAR